MVLLTRSHLTACAADGRRSRLPRPRGVRLGQGDGLQQDARRGWVIATGPVEAEA